MTFQKIRVLCVDDHAFLVEGLRARFALENDIEFAGTLSSADRLIPVVRETSPDVVLLDIEMPGPDPFEAMRELNRRFPSVRTILLSAYVRDHYLEACVEAGGWGYLSKSDDPETICAAIRKVMNGDFALGLEVRERCRIDKRPDARPRSRLALLTRREQEILRLIGRGLTRTQIASTLHRSPKTIDAHRGSIMEKLGIHDRVDLVRYAIREGLVEP